MENILEPVWESELETMDVIFDICKKLNLRCYLGYGTLIGAVRHHGFIPWDDDVDLVMPRMDYEIFIQKAPEFLPQNMVLNHYQISNAIDASSTLKVENTSCRILRTYGEVKTWANAWVDIWPTDGVPNGRIPLILFKIGTMVRLCLCRLCDIEVKGVNAEEKPFVENLIININKFFHIGKLMNRKKRYNHLEKFLRKHAFDSCGRTVMIMGDERFDATMHTEWYGKPTFIDFAGKKYPAPAEYDLVLRQIFGDYMKLPPIEKQVCKHLIEVKLNK